MRGQAASPGRIDSGPAGVRPVMTRCALALQRTNARDKGASYVNGAVVVVDGGVEGAVLCRFGFGSPGRRPRHASS
jgi:hypothetical protein